MLWSEGGPLEHEVIERTGHFTEEAQLPAWHKTRQFPARRLH